MLIISEDIKFLLCMLSPIKAGSTNPKAKLFVVDTINPSRRTQVVVPDSIGAGYSIISYF